jgi:hypothetical protein
VFGSAVPLRQSRWSFLSADRVCQLCIPVLRVVVRLLLERSTLGAVSGMLQWRNRDDVGAVVSDLLRHLLFR